jgi:voltage-gated potassium channel Kch
MLIVALSMAMTPLLMIFYSRTLMPLFMSRLPETTYDQIDAHERSVILAGYGRFGQIIGRFMRAQGVKLTILESDPDQLELIRRFGNKVYFGDATRLDLLKSAGADKAAMLIVAIDNADKALEVVSLAKREFPHLKILARARNRRHAYELHKAGADFFRRETFDSAMVVAQKAMKMLGHSAMEVRRKAKQFKQHDERTLKASFAFFEREPELISFTRQATQELARILQDDVKSNDPSI